MLHKVSGPFDVIFQDGDKKLYGPMLDKLIRVLRPGGLLITDNVLWNGEVADTEAIKAYNEQIHRHPLLLTSIVPLRDGVAISVKL